MSCIGITNDESLI